MNIDTNSPAYKMMQDNRAEYEKYVLVALHLNAKLWGQMSPYLCVDASSQRPTRDFEHPHYTGLYLALKMHRQMAEDAEQEFCQASDNAFFSCLYTLALDPKTSAFIDEDDIQELFQEWKDMMQSTSEADALAIVTPTWQVWLQNVKAQHLARYMTRTDGEHSKEHIEKLMETQQAIADATSEASFDTILGVINSPNTKSIERFPMSPKTWGHLNEALGGGFGRGEHVLGIAPSGGGKTVFACQLAVEMMYSGKNVLFISTEEPLARVIPRFATCMSYGTNNKIPYRAIKGRPKFEEYLPAEKCRPILENMKRIHPHLMYKDWTGGMNARGKARKYDITELNAEVEHALKYFNERGESLDMVILDWLGATLRAGVTDSGMLRIIYSNAATRMKEIAVHYNVAAVSMAQASPDSVKKMKIDNTCVAECHSLHNEAVAAFGISHLSNAADEGGSARDSFRDTQCFNVFKARNGNPQSFWMRENFDFQRFDAP